MVIYGYIHFPLQILSNRATDLLGVNFNANHSKQTEQAKLPDKNSNLDKLLQRQLCYRWHS